MSKFVLCLILLRSSIAYAQIDAVGSGHAVRFDGIDDFIDVGNVYDDLQLPFTISAWVSFPEGTNGGPVFVSQDNSPIYNGFWFIVRPSVIGIEYGDGLGENNPAFRRGKSAAITIQANQWTHVCAIVKGANDIQIFLNGVNVGGNYGGSSTSPMASNFPADVAKIGYFLSNGIIYRFSGTLDHIQLFNRALAQQEIQKNMTRKLMGNEAGLIGYWTFDEKTGSTVFDKSINQFHGQAMGAPSRNFSGAAIGDESNFLYTNSWSAATVNLSDQAVKDIQGNPAGVHLYQVNSMPSQTSGLGATVTDRYYGVFVADADMSYGYSFSNNTNTCSSFRRADNSQSTWSSSTVLTGTNERVEFFLIASSSEPFELELGPNQVLCDQTSLLLESGIVNASGKTFRWSTGASSSSIEVTRSGIYSVTVEGDCTLKKDSVSVSFLQSPLPFSLGEDKIVCELQTTIVRPELSGDFNFIWQDGSSAKEFSITKHGTYWLTLENTCGQITDTIHFVKPDQEFEIPNVITPNGDAYNENFVILPTLSDAALSVYNRWGKLVFQTFPYKNDWDGEDLPSGIYFYTLNIGCIGDRKGILNLLR